MLEDVLLISSAAGFNAAENASIEEILEKFKVGTARAKRRRPRYNQSTLECSPIRGLKIVSPEKTMKKIQNDLEEENCQGALNEVSQTDRSASGDISNLSKFILKIPSKNTRNLPI